MSIENEDEIIHQLADELSKLKTINEQIGTAKDAAEQMRQSTEEIINKVEDLIDTVSDIPNQIEKSLQQQKDAYLSEMKQIHQALKLHMEDEINKLTGRIDKLSESQQKQNEIIARLTNQLESQTKILERIQQNRSKKRHWWQIFSSKD